MPTDDQCHTASKRNCHDLRKHHGVNGTKETPVKDFSPNDIKAGDSHHQEHRSESYPLKPGT
jgi:hypothetical protein